MAEIAQTFALNPYAAEAQKLERQRKYAEILQAQGLQPEGKHSYAGIEAPPSAAGALAKGLQLGMSGFMQGRADRKYDDLIGRATAGRKSVMDKVVAALQGTEAVPEVPGSVAATEADVRDREMGMNMGTGAAPMTMGQQIPTQGGMGEGPNVGAPPQAAVPGSMEAANALMIGSEFPDLQAAGLSGMVARQAAKDARLLTLQDAETKAENDRKLKLSPGYRNPVPGVDVPYSPEIAGQLTDIAGARAAAARETPEEAALRASIIADANPTQDQRLAAGFADRMHTANLEFDALSKAGYNPTNLGDRVAADKLPTVIANFMTSPEGQRWRTAQENWIRANLRKESGAVIGPDEMNKEIENYFPSPGATPAAIAQKARLRSQLTENMKMAGAGAYKALVKGRPTPSGVKKPDDIRQEDWDRLTPEDRLLWK